MNQNILELLETPLVPDAQAKVLSYFEEVKGSDTGWQLAITELTRTADHLSDHTKFFWWQIVENFVKTRYAQMDSSSLLMRNFLFQWLHNMAISAKEESSFLRNKAAQVFSLVFIVDFPQRWQSFLVDFLQTLKLGPKAVDFYLRVLKAIDSEVVDREIPHSKEEADRNTLIKDTIRETCINDLVNSWYHICVLYEMSDSNLVSECLDVIGAYISWIDISLIANERFVTLFIRFMKDQRLREPDCDCLCEVVAKGMDSSAKVKLIESLYSLLHGAGVFVIDNEEDSDYLCKLGKLINTMGVQLAVSWTKLKKVNDIKDAAVALDAIENKLPVIYSFLGNEDDDVSASVLEYIKEYIIILKQKALLSSVDRQYLESLISINFEKMKYDESYNFDNDGDEEAQFLEFRKQLKNLYDNIASLDKDLILSQTQQLVTRTLTNWQNFKFQDVELAITCLHELGEAIPSSQGNHFASDMAKASALQVMVRTMVACGVFAHPHPAVKLQFFESVVRYNRFFLCEPDHIPNVTMTFLDERGMRHPSPKVRSRVSYLFSRFVKTVKPHLSNYTEDILAQLSDLLILSPFSETTSSSFLSPDDQLYIFETAATLIINANSEQNTKILLIQQLLEPVMTSFITVLDQVRREAVPVRIAVLDKLAAQAVNACTWCSKAFSSQLAMRAVGCGPTFVEAIQIFLKSAEVPTLLPEFQGALRQYCHRLVVCLDKDILPLMPAISETLLRSRDATSLSEYIPLINQVTTKFKKDIIPFLNAAFQPIVGAIFAALALPVEEDEEIRLERQTLQRSYFSFIAAVCGNHLVDVLLSQDPNIMQQVLMSIIQGATELNDPMAQKGCYSILKKLVELWGKNGPPGFVEFLYKQIVPACFLGPLRKTFDLSDAQTVVALNEASACLKLIYDQRGEEAITFLQSHHLPSLDLPAPKILEFCQALRMEAKLFKQFLKAFFLEAKR